MNRPIDSSENISLKANADDDVRSLRLPTTNLTRFIISENFQKELTGKLSGTVQVLNESDFRGKLVQGLLF